VRKAEELRPDIIGLSGLLTVATDRMKATVDAVRGAEKRLDRRVPVIIGGGIVDEQTADWTGADLWANDASRGVRLIREEIAAARSRRLATGRSVQRAAPRRG
jgi:methanogenic corrinoid protein MtbC1